VNITIRTAPNEIFELKFCSINWLKILKEIAGNGSSVGDTAVTIGRNPNAVMQISIQIWHEVEAKIRFTKMQKAVFQILDHNDFEYSS
jgi:hypothetical protein